MLSCLKPSLSRVDRIGDEGKSRRKTQLQRSLATELESERAAKGT